MQESLGDPEVAPLRNPPTGKTPQSGRDLARGVRPASVFACLDVAAVIVATAPALVLGVPLFGYLVGAVAWVLQRVLAHADRRWIGRRREPRTQLGLNLFEAFGRIWLLAGAIVLAGLAGDRADGLTAALVIFGAYSLAFVVKVIGGPPARPPATGPPARPPTAGAAQRSATTPAGGVAASRRSTVQ